MGLDLRVKGYRTEHTKISSYIGFGEFRRAWAQRLGFNLDEMEGLGGTKKWTNEPLQCFFNHSDCDGELTVEECKQILPHAETDLQFAADQQSQYCLPILIRFLKKAIEKNQPIEFV